MIVSYFAQLLQSTVFYGLRLRLWRQINAADHAAVDLWPGNLIAGKALLEGYVHQYNSAIDGLEIGNILADNYTEQSEGGLFFHDFEWLRDLRAVGTNSSRKKARQLIYHWIQHNNSLLKKIWLLPSWQPPLIARRLKNWLSLYDFFGATAGEDFRGIFWKSFNWQLCHLLVTYKNQKNNNKVDKLEHLQTLLCLIFIAGSLQTNKLIVKNYLTDLGETLLKDWLCNQRIFACAPDLQCLILKDLIDVKNIIRSFSLPAEQPLLQRAIHLLVNAVRILRHTTGDLSGFIGGLANSSGYLSTFSRFKRLSATTVDMVLSLADAKPKPSNDSIPGYQKIFSRGGILIVNTKPSGFWLGNEDAGMDILGLEWSIPHYGLVCQGDLVIHSKQGELLTSDREFDWDNPLSPLLVKKQQSEGHSHLLATYNSTSISIERELYLSNEVGDFRGTDSVTAVEHRLYSIRFIFHRNVELVTVSKMGVVLTLSQQNTIERKSGDFKTCRLAVAGKDKTLTHYLPDGRLVVIFITHLLPLEQKSIKWFFQFDS